MLALRLDDEALSRQVGDGLSVEGAGATATPTQEEEAMTLLRQLQKRYTDTSEFAGAYRDYDGLPVNTSVQMDAEEFFSLLFDKLELALKRTRTPRLLKGMFGGETVNQILGSLLNPPRASPPNPAEPAPRLPSEPG
ncbi:hypothetical protein T492DRAFT_883187 [Pavlovales sp. CCMP2436]|nr:hypothetical protein T492DRAFT_883187 [Pavlovales sp. CCMP2436]